MGKFETFSLFLLFSCIFADSFTPINVDELVWNPNTVTKKSVLAEHNKMKRQSLRNGTVVVAIISPWNPRGYHLVRKTIDRLTYITPVWFEVLPLFVGESVTSAKISGRQHMNMQFIHEMRQRRCDIKIVPHFKFANILPEFAAMMVSDEGMVQKVAQAIANFCHEFGFDGAFIEMFMQTTYRQKPEIRLMAFEAMVQMGNVIRRNGLVSILSLPSPLTRVKDNIFTPFLTKEELGMVLPAHDHCLIHTYNDVSMEAFNRIDKSTWIRRNVEYAGYPPNLLLGLNWYGVEYKLNEYRRHTGTHKFIDGKRYIQVLKDEEAMLWYNTETVEHELTLRHNNSLIFFPSMTSLEYRMRLAHELNAGLVLWDYGQGLDYFTNLV